MILDWFDIGNGILGMIGLICIALGTWVGYSWGISSAFSLLSSLVDLRRYHFGRLDIVLSICADTVFATENVY